eukprot:1193796-Rhodomonas_salina.1
MGRDAFAPVRSYSVALVQVILPAYCSRLQLCCKVPQVGGSRVRCGGCRCGCSRRGCDRMGVGVVLGHGSPARSPEAPPLFAAKRVLELLCQSHQRAARRAEALGAAGGGGLGLDCKRLRLCGKVPLRRFRKGILRRTIAIPGQFSTVYAPTPYTLFQTQYTLYWAELEDVVPTGGTFQYH